MRHPKRQGGGGIYQFAPTRVRICPECGAKFAVSTWMDPAGNDDLCSDCAERAAEAEEEGDEQSW